jgi:hypothetical protein
MTALNMHNDLFDHVLRFQFVQESPALVILRVVPASGFGETHAERIRNEISQKIGSSVELRIETTERIGLGPGGKHRLLIQNVPVGEMVQRA